MRRRGVFEAITILEAVIICCMTLLAVIVDPASAFRTDNVIHVAVIAPDQPAFISYRCALPAVELAFQTISLHDSSLKHYRFQLSCMCRYNWSSSEDFDTVEAELQAAYDKNKLDVIVGPAFPGYVSKVARFANATNTPVLSIGAFQDGDQGRESFPQLIYMGPANRHSLTELLLLLLDQYETNTINLVYEGCEDDQDFHQFLCQNGIQNLMASLNQSGRGIDASVYNVNNDGLTATSLLYQVYTHRSLILLCTSSRTVRDIMITAQDIGFDTRNNFFFNLDLSTSGDVNSYLWYNESDTLTRNEKAKKAFQALQTITVRRRASLDFRHFSMAVKRRALDMYRDVSLGEGELSPYVGAYHDALILYATAVSAALEDGVSLSDDRGIITRYMKNRTFEGIGGHIAVDELGDRLGDLSILNMNPNTLRNQVVANYFGGRHMYEPVPGTRIYRPDDPADNLKHLPESSDVHVEATPGTTVVEGQETRLSCWTNLTTNVIMIVMQGKQGENLVLVRGGNKITFTKDVSNTMQAEGLATAQPQPGGANYLNLTLLTPRVEDSGEYTCVVHSINDQGSLDHHVSKINLTVYTLTTTTTTTTTSAPSTTTEGQDGQFSSDSILSNLLDRLVQVELHGETKPFWMIGLSQQEKDYLTNVVANRSKNTTSSIFANGSADLKVLTDRLAMLESVVYSHNHMANDSFCGPSGSCVNPQKESKVEKEILSRVETLEKEHDNVTRQLNKLSETEEAAIAFRSTFDQLGLAIRKGQTMAFPDLLTSQGTGFDPRTGVFTAPRNGIYAFHLSIVNTASGSATIGLEANGRYFAILSTGTARERGQSSVSAVVDLKVGDKVRALVTDVQGQVELSGYGYSAFTGYLIWAS